MNFIICYLFDTADCNGLNDHSLENKEQCHCRNHCNYGCCHDQSIITLNCIIGIEGTYNHLQCPVLFASQENSRCKIIIPDSHKPQHQLRCQSPLHQWHKNLKKRTEISTSIQFCCFHQIIRNSDQVLSKEKDNTDISKASRNNKWKQSIGPAQFGKHDILWNHDNRKRNHNGCQQCQKQCIFATKSHFCKSECGEGGGKSANNQYRNCNLQRIKYTVYELSLFNTSEYFPIRIGSGRIVNVPDKI